LTLTHWIVPTISLSKSSIIQYRLFTCTSISLSKTTVGQSLLYLIRRVAMYWRDDMFLQHGTCTLLLERLPVARQSGHFPLAMNPWT
jgi:hypothetical protein